MFETVRTRLTLWYVGVLALVLLVFGAGAYFLLARNLYQRVDVGLQSALESMAYLIIAERAEGEPPKASAISTVEELHYQNIAMAVFDAQGHLLAEKTAPGRVQSRLPDQTTVSGELPAFITIKKEQTGEKEDWRAASQRVIAAATNESYLIVVTQSLDPVVAELKSLREGFYLAAPMALLLAGLGGWLLARKSLAPVVIMSERARRISAENLEQRLPIANPRDELGQLAATLNELLARLNGTFDQQRQFMADASHELRTPVYVIQTATEVTLEQSHRDENEYREALIIIDQQVRRLTRIVEDMFTLARADAGHRELEQTDFYLDELLYETVRAAQVLANRKGVEVKLNPTPETLFRGDEVLVRQMLLNLLDNAIKYTQQGGSVDVSLSRCNATCEIMVEDTGMGIPPEAQQQIFKRFYRVDKARARSEHADGSGAGLGLSIARWIAEQHGGKLELRRSNERGSTFVASLSALHHN